MHRVLKEPLLHFLLLGAAIFGAFKLTAQNDAGEPHGNALFSVYPYSPSCSLCQRGKR